ncbi:MAG: transketolase, partial [Pseudolabrys sp.]|nr:transketolase [Pseudolabrys sp.]
MADDLKILRELEKKVLWLASWMIHNANHLREHPDGLKVGGHQSSSASIATIMTALYFDILKPADRVAVKPHGAPIFHAIQYLLGWQTAEKMGNFRGFKGVQSYPSRTKDTADIDYSTGSVGLGVAQILFGSLVQDYVRAHGWGLNRPEGRMIALAGDAELDEGNIFEALLEGWKQDLRNCWWIIDYNRQSLDAVVREGLWERYEQLFRNFGWDVVILKYGSLQQAAFKEPGGDKLKAWIDRCPNSLYSALVFAGGAAWRKRLNDEIGDKGDVSRLIAKRSDAELAALMNNLGGHDLPSIRDAFKKATSDKPTCFICYTIKGFGLPMAGHKDNHAGLMTPTQMESYREASKIRPGREWDKFEGLDLPTTELQDFLDRVPLIQEGRRRLSAPEIETPAELQVPAKAVTSTQAGFGDLLNEIGKADSDFARRIVTTSPDVTVSTNLGPWVNRRKLFGRSATIDTFKSERIPSTFNWEFSPQGQHIELGIAEANLFILLSALGLSHTINGERLLPIGTVYDPFIARGLDQLNYACYQDARFMIVATPSGITLAPEGGAHQSVSEPLICMAQDGLASFEPAYVDELATIMAWSFAYMQKEKKEADPSERSWLRDETGGSVYLRLSTRPVEQIQWTMTG